MREGFLSVERLFSIFGQAGQCSVFFDFQCVFHEIQHLEQKGDAIMDSIG